MECVLGWGGVAGVGVGDLGEWRTVMGRPQRLPSALYNVPQEVAGLSKSTGLAVKTSDEQGITLQHE